MSAKEAQKIADSKNLDLVKIAPNAVPPVCKIMDYGKYKFEQAKKEREARKKQKIIEVKEVRVSPVIENHDFEFKARNAQRFLEDGDKVKITVKFRGRELNYISQGEAVLEKFAKFLEAYGVVEKKPKLEGRNMVMVIAPKR